MKKNHVMGIILVCGFIIAGVNVMKTRPAENHVSEKKVKSGYQALLLNEKTSVTKVQKDIEKAKATPTPPPAVTGNPNQKQYSILELKKIFENSVVVGDSVVEAASDYDCLNESSLMYKRGVSVGYATDLFTKAAALHPQNVFLVFGLNDMQLTAGNAKQFTNAYKKQLKKLMKKMDASHIFVNSILPVSAKGLADEPAFKYVEKFDKALQSMCQEVGVTYLDNAYLMAQGEKAGKNMYEPDGYHPSYTYYPMWLQRMAIAARMIR